MAKALDINYLYRMSVCFCPFRATVIVCFIPKGVASLALGYELVCLSARAYIKDYFIVKHNCFAKNLSLRIDILMIVTCKIFNIVLFDYNCSDYFDCPLCTSYP